MISITFALCLQWHGGDTLCRLVAFVRLFSVCLTSNLMVVIALNKAFISQWLAMHINGLSTVARLQRMFACACILAIMCSCGQLVLWCTFDVGIDINTNVTQTQCVTWWMTHNAIVQKLMTRAFEKNFVVAAAELNAFDDIIIDMEETYTYALQVTQFWGPLAIIAASYVMTMLSMRRELV